MLVPLDIRRLARSAILRLVNAAKAEEELRMRERAADFVTMGNGCSIDLSRTGFKPGCRLELGNEIKLVGEVCFEREGGFVGIGNRTYFASIISCAQEVLIGEDVLVSRGGYIADHASHAVQFELRKNDVVDNLRGKKDWTNVAIKPVKIGNKVWLGWNVAVLSGVTIGEGAVIGANSVVTRDIPPFVVAAGAPARPIREIPRPFVEA